MIGLPIAYFTIFNKSFPQVFIFMAIIHGINICDAFSSHTLTAIRNQLSGDQVNEMIRKVKESSPTSVILRAHCYHHEQRTTGTGKNKSTKTVTVTLHNDVKEIPIAYTYDKTPAFQPTHDVFTIYSEMLYECGDLGQKAALPKAKVYYINIYIYLYLYLYQSLIYINYYCYPLLQAAYFQMHTNCDRMSTVGDEYTSGALVPECMGYFISLPLCLFVSHKHVYNVHVYTLVQKFSLLFSLALAHIYTRLSLSYTHISFIILSHTNTHMLSCKLTFFLSLTYTYSFLDTMTLIKYPF